MKRALLPVVLAAALAGCSSSPSGPASAYGTQQCSVVWKVGKVLPKGYEGCTLPNGDLETAAEHDCGGGMILAYGEHMWAIAGQPIHHTTMVVAADPGYKRAYGSC